MNLFFKLFMYALDIRTDNNSTNVGSDSMIHRGDINILNNTRSQCIRSVAGTLFTNYLLKVLYIIFTSETSFQHYWTREFDVNFKSEIVPWKRRLYGKVYKSHHPNFASRDRQKLTLGGPY